MKGSEVMSKGDIFKACQLKLANSSFFSFCQNLLVSNNSVIRYQDHNFI